METMLKRVLLAALVVALPLGFPYAVGRETTSWRSCVTWAGLRISPYNFEDNDLSRWVKETLGHHPETEEWTQTTLGPWWVFGKIGTPPGNWLYLSSMHTAYLRAPSETERQRCIDLARKVAQASTVPEKQRIYKEWMEN